MTLILALGNREHFIQLSDRGLTNNGRIVDDESNKAAVWVCRNARLVFGFTGLGRVNGFETREWLLESLYDCCPPDYSVHETLERLKDKASEDFRQLPALKRVSRRDKRLTVMFSGYVYNGPHQFAGCVVLTNFQNLIAGTDDPDAWDHFESNYWTPKTSLLDSFTFVQRVGAYAPMNSSDEAVLRKLLIDRKPAQAIAGKAVELMLEIADRPKAKGTIGKQVSTVILPSEPNTNPTASYYSSVTSYDAYLPSQLITFADDNRSLVTEVRIQHGNAKGPKILAVPKVRRNHPCPCNSGKKYKSCHGR